MSIQLSNRNSSERVHKMGRGTLQDPFLALTQKTDPFLDIEENATTIQKQLNFCEFGINKNKSRRNRIAIALCLSLLLIGISVFIFSRQFSGQETLIKSNDKENVVTSEYGVVAADHETCSEIGAEVLGRPEATAVDATVAVAFCLGVVNPTSSGIGGGAFMVVGSSTGSVARAYDMRETAPSTAYEKMFEKREPMQKRGPLSIATPGEVAGLYKAWEKHGSTVKWELLVEPSIKLARYGFKVGPHLAFAIDKNKGKIKDDEFGLGRVFINKGKFLKEGDTCYNRELANTLEKVAKRGMKAFYEGDVAEMLVNDVNKAGGNMTTGDLKNYEVIETDAMIVDDVMGYKIQGMWPPSSGTAGFAMVMNVLAEYKNVYDAGENLGLHRVIEAMKYMLAARMDLGDPGSSNATSKIVDKMISKPYAKIIKEKISDEETYPPEHYLSKFLQLEDQGTSHFCVVDKHRNIVSMTTTVNYAFGSGFMSPSTGIILNNQMADFAIPLEGITLNSLPPAEANYIAPKKRPLSSMMPLIITKDNELVGVIGASGGIYIIPAVIQVFLNHFVLNMSPLDAVKSPRVYHKLEPNEVLYEDWKVYNEDHIKLNEKTQEFLSKKKHVLLPTQEGATVQFVVQKRVDDYTTVLTAVSDLRKGGKPAAANAAPAPAPAPSPMF